MTETRRSRMKKWFKDSFVEPKVTYATRKAVMLNIVKAKSCDLKYSVAGSEGLGLARISANGHT